MTRVNRFLIVPLSVVVSFGVIVAAIAGVMALWEPPSLESILPAAHTLAILRNGHVQEIFRVEGTFETLPPFPIAFSPDIPNNETVDAAVLRLPNGTLAWVARPVPYRVVDEATVRVGRQVLVASDPAVETLLASVTKETSAAEDYRLLAKGLSDEASTVYMQDGTNGMPPHLRSLMLGASGSFLIASDPATKTIQIRATRTVPAIRPVSGAMRDLSPSPQYSIEAADPQEVIDAYLASFSALERPAQLARLQKIMLDALPGEWSWIYDIAPLLAQPATIRVRSNTGGTLVFLAEGNATDAAAARELLSRAHDAFLAALPGTLTHRLLDRGLVSNVLKSNDAIEEQEWNRGGYAARETHTGDDVLVSARSGKKFLIGNSREWLNQILEDLGVTSPMDPGIARGVLSLTHWRTILGDDAEHLFLFLRPDEDSDEVLGWALWRDMGIVGLTLRQY